MGGDSGIHRRRAALAIAVLAGVGGCSGGTRLEGDAPDAQVRDAETPDHSVVDEGPGPDAGADAAEDLDVAESPEAPGLEADAPAEVAEPACGDGVVDPGEECDGVPPRECATAAGEPGAQACVDCAWGTCFEPGPEVCNDIDDDGDGSTDEALWCWVNPRPFGARVSLISGSAADDVWMAGARGFLAHSDGRSWTTSCIRDGVLSPVALWALAPDAAYLTTRRGTEAVYRWDGAAWLPMGLALPYDGAEMDLWASSPEDVWAVGAFHTYHWDGVAWTDVAADLGVEYATAVFGFAADDVWIVSRNLGTGPVVTHWDGRAWTPVPVTGHDVSLFDVWGTSSADLWAVGEDGVVVRWDGTAWSTSQAIDEGGLRAVWGFASDDVWAAGERGAVAHWDGTTWTETRLGEDDVSAIWGPASDDLWVSGGTAGVPWHWDGAVWASPSGVTASDLAGVWGADPDEVWAVGSEDTLLRWTGHRWTVETTGGALGWRAVWGSTRDDAWVVGDGGRTRHWDGTSWTDVDSGTRLGLTAIAGVAGDDAWAAGDGGVILHWDGTRWQVASAGVDWWDWGWYDVWVAPGGGVWFGSNGGDVARWDGTAWTERTHLCGPPSGDVHPPDPCSSAGTLSVRVWEGADGGEGWAATRLGGFYTRLASGGWSDDGAWAEAVSVVRLWGGGSPAGARAVGPTGMLHWDGVEWVRDGDCTGQRFGGAAIWSFPGEEAWVVGDQGAILRRRE